MGTLLERQLPEQRLFLRSGNETRFIRLRPETQAIAILGSALLVAWTIFATAVLLIGSISSGNTREQAMREQAVYEARLDALSRERDMRAGESAAAQDRFAVALSEVSKMQSALLASEERRKELETGIGVIQNTLRTAMAERDSARAEAERITVALADQTGSTKTENGRSEDVAATLDYLTAALGRTAKERDDMVIAADTAISDAEEIALEKRLLEDRNNHIFTQLEEAVTVSMEPLDKMFTAAGMDPDDLISQVQKGYSGTGGPLMPLGISTKGDPTASQDEARANKILEGLDRMNMYRIAAEKAPFAVPVQTSFRFTSPFGPRRDPIHGGSRMHEGTDFAAAYGTPITSTADGVVTHAGWSSGYGKLVKIKHEFGIETRYGHMSEIRVEVGQRVSRGDRIGDMGSTGRSTGTHLHYEVRIGGNAVNPMTYIKAAKNVF